MKFYLGLQDPGWASKAGVPGFVSASRLRGRKRLKAATAPWALDSAGFTEIDKNGRYLTEPAAYAAEARLWATTMGMPDFAAIQDWTCYPESLAKTGLTVEANQEATVASYLELKRLDPGLPWMPVLQGWTWADFMRHAEMHEQAGVRLAEQPVVGFGSVGMRQDAPVVMEAARDLHRMGIRLHAFGVKGKGIARCASWIASADSMAWSAEARWGNIRLEGCQHAKCANCLKWALKWREGVLASIEEGHAHCRYQESQGLLF